MAHLKAPASRMPTADHVPVELYDGDAITWHSEPAFRAWIDQHTNGLPAAPLAALWGPYSGCWRRRLEAQRAWAVTVGLVHPRLPDWPDQKALELLGLPTGVAAVYERVRRHRCATCRRLGLPVWADRRDD